MPRALALLLAGLLLGSGLSGCAVTEILAPVAAGTPAGQSAPSSGTEAESDSLISRLDAEFMSPYPEESPAPEELDGRLKGNPAFQGDATALPGATPTAQPRQLQRTSDLLVLSGQNLLRWDHVTGFTGLLAENVVDYSVSADGKRIALLRPHNVAANGVERFDLELLDLETMTIQTLLPELAPLTFLRISPDGAQVAYLGGAQSQGVSVLQVASPDQSLALGDCQECVALSWSPDNKALLWIDQRGAWLASPGKPPAALVHSGQVEVNDPKGAALKLLVQFAAPRWSPAGRFVLLQVANMNSDVHWQALLDTRQGRMIEVPDSFEMGETTLSLIWLADGKLALGKAGDFQANPDPFIRLWRVVPTSTELLQHEKTYTLTSPFLAAGLETALGVAKPRLVWLAALDDDTLALGLRPAQSSAMPLLFTVDLKGGLSLPLSEIPANLNQASWAPDGSGVLVWDASGKVFFLSITGDLLDITASLGASPASFTWLPPAERD